MKEDVFSEWREDSEIVFLGLKNAQNTDKNNLKVLKAIEGETVLFL